MCTAEITAAPGSADLLRTDGAFGAGYRCRQVELCPWPPDPLSDGLWAAVIDDCRGEQDTIEDHPYHPQPHLSKWH